MFDVIMETIDLDLPAFMGKLFSYVANPGLIIPAVLLMVYVCRRYGDFVLLWLFLYRPRKFFMTPPIKMFQISLYVVLKTTKKTVKKKKSLKIFSS